MTTRVFVYDKTQGWLTGSFWFGAALRSLRPGLDVTVPVASWLEMVDALKDLSDIECVEYWGHGASGRALCAGVPLVTGEVAAQYEAAKMEAWSVSDILQPLHQVVRSEGLWFWRSCATAYGLPGRDFLAECVGALDCRVAGCRYKTWLWQSGVSVVAPHEAPPEWPKDGGVWSKPWSPDTIFCMSAGPV